MRQVTPTQALLLSQRDTTPVYLVALGDEERLSTSGDRDVDGVAYLGGDVGLSAMQDWSQASISLTPTPERVRWMLSGAYRGMSCSISLLPGALFGHFVQDYWDDDYAFEGESFDEPLLLMPGRLDSARLAGNGRVELQVVHRTRTARWSPSFRIGPPWCNHLPRGGEVIQFAGTRYTVEVRE